METPLLERFINFINSEHLAKAGDRILLTVSGGSDSMMLADLFSQTSFAFGIAHCNFQLRGEDSIRDETFVSAYCEKQHIPFYCTRFDTAVYAAEQRVSIQEAARTLRYEWFEQVRTREGYSAIATAHHLNDHIETLLLNFCKGSGIRGLHGIPVKNGRVIRPMRFIPKKEVLEYIAKHHLSYVEDSSNQSDKYTRNFLRHQVIPLLDKAFPGIEQRLEQSIHRFGEAEQLYDQAIAGYQKDLIFRQGAEYRIPILKLKKVQPLVTVVYELFRQWNFTADQSRQIVSMLEGPPGKIITSASHQMIRDRTWLIIAPLGTLDLSQFLITEGVHRLVLPEGTLQFKEIPRHSYNISPDPHVAALDASQISYPLTLRRWEQGDYFYPLGLRKKKKLSRFFIDQKLPLHEKQKVWVLLSGQRIVWIAGMRIDDRFKVTASTTTVLEIKYLPHKKQEETG